MVFGFLKKQDAFDDNHFWREYYTYFFVGLAVLFLLAMCAVSLVLYQVWHRPLPTFQAIDSKRSQRLLTPFESPNLLPDTLLRWAAKATIAAYTFDFVNYSNELAIAREYFTEAGWTDFRGAINATLGTVIKNQLFVTAVVTGAPVIVNQGELPDKGYVYRVQIPFLVTYQSANTLTKSSYIVVLSIVHVPTTQNPQGIGIDQFIMANPYG
ncbi:MAG: hypothetical protein A3F43_00780 [Gammaproteobacteria bacterium RIFCSPHIGHO2_12_FULL_42_10]|nr:MAG: hypothetical protein A3F43_00780 [Gammaproteobacteria bacterium RIFCSPHIGHO2_12_FULL_42_10]